ncbi:uncharacterized protein LOC141605216 [Silene latifolia]|uniref:uncharacterized protein LOC141605216 n=1 Tax=Silene latifolia TaxID=37657 RepID=UPI003D76C865
MHIGAMSSLVKPPVGNVSLSGLCYRSQNCTSYHIRVAPHNIRMSKLSVCCSKLNPWEPTPLTYAPTDEAEDKPEPELFETTQNIFETLQSEKVAQTTSKPPKERNFLKWPLWVLGPAFLLGTGMAPTLWLPTSSIFLGPNIASLMSLVGLDCIFNLGATLFLLMAHSTTQSKDPSQAPKSKAPFSYKFWNMFASIVGYVIPLTLLYGSQNGILQPQLANISFLVLLGPYLLLLSVQMLTELLTWHWQSPVWLVTPVIYEAYRVLQLMRGLKLSAELNAPAWMGHTLRGLVCWWVLILGLQLMRVAWFAGFSAKARRAQDSVDVLQS